MKILINIIVTILSMFSIGSLTDYSTGEFLIVSRPVQFHISHVYVGIASFYGIDFQGREMANGCPFDMKRMTCAALPEIKMGSTLEVTNLSTGLKVIVTVTDRGDFWPRKLDLSDYAARRIGITKKEGIGLVSFRIIKNGDA